MKNYLLQRSLGGALSLGLLFTQTTFGQTGLQFTSVVPTDEQAIRLTWASSSNEVYEIDEADALASNPDGTTAWNKLYDDYPSQGTNTFWLDTGNYNYVPQILHPKNMPMRFYRIVDLGADTTSDQPSVSITSPSNGTAVSGELTIVVVASSDQPVIAGTKLYVDGQAMQMADSRTNYTESSGVTNYEIDSYSINTCEWGNETHILFATTECQTGFGDSINAGAVATGHGVSAFVPVLFSNLVTRISFSQPSFDPASGQTQQVSAVFAANCNWTLNIRDGYSNAVKSATGSGTSMLFNWDGTGNGGTDLPTGIYYYYISAQTNGASSYYTSGGSSGNGAGGPPSPSFTSMSSAGSDSGSATELWALSPESSEPPLPLAIIPPGFDTNGFTIFEASQYEVQALTQAVLAENKPLTETKSIKLVSSTSSSSFQSDNTSGGSSASSQDSPPAPQRPPANPVKGLAGTFGVGYDSYTGNGPGGVGFSTLPNGSLAGGHVAFENKSASFGITWKPLPLHKPEADNFVFAMQHYGWNNTLYQADAQLNVNNLRGSGTPFNNVSLGLLILHGTYGTSLDFAANQCFQMYFPITAGGQYLRMSEMNLGGSGTNGLKWMAIKACHSLYHVNWSSMKRAFAIPYNSNLHLLLGSDTDSASNDSLSAYWAKYMNFGTSTNYNPLTIRAAWYQAAKDAYRNIPFPNGSVISFVVAGDSACIDDMLQTNNTPTGNWFIDTPVQVYPYQ